MCLSQKTTNVQTSYLTSQCTSSIHPLSKTRGYIIINSQDQGKQKVKRG
uniref:Uncharacterized protein n=1 Tax=Rhizophora mucronata TaxID=61149 RepID=A0A2P2NHC9_RHIMU